MHTGEMSHCSDELVHSNPLKHYQVDQTDLKAPRHSRVDRESPHSEEEFPTSIGQKPNIKCPKESTTHRGYCACSQIGTLTSAKPGQTTSNHSQCLVCVKGFIYSTDLDWHMQAFHKEETVHSRCFFCVRGFLKEDDLELHISTHIKKERFCLCG